MDPRLPWFNRFALLPLFLCLLSLPVEAKTPPEEMLRGVSDQLLNRLETQKETVREHPEQLFDIVKETLVYHVDTEVMSRMVLGVHWRRADEEQRRRFTGEFETLLIRFYVSALLDRPEQLDRLLQNTDSLITFLPSGEIRDRRARVRAEVHPPDGPTVPVTFSVFDNGERWMIYDVNVDGISLVINYRNSFSSQVSREGLTALIDQLAERNEQLWQKTVANGVNPPAGAPER